MNAALARRIRAHLNSAIEYHLHQAGRAIALLDAIDADPDFEADADFEPALGASENHPLPSWTRGRDDSGSQLENWSQPDVQDREDDGDDLEPSLGQGAYHTDAGPMDDLELDGCDNEHSGDDEYSLGWNEKCSQSGVGLEGWAEVDGVDEGHSTFRGEGYSVGNAMLRSAGLPRVRVSCGLPSIDPDTLTRMAPGVARIGGRADAER